MIRELVSTFWNASTLSINPGLQKHLSRNMLFSMPQMREETAVIFGATKATLLVAAEAYKQSHRKFVIVGGKPIGQENGMLAKLVKERTEAAGLKILYPDHLPENLFGKYSLQMLFGVPEKDIVTFEDDRSTNFQQNMEVLMAHGYHERPVMEAYSLAGTARRLIGTAHKVWGRSDEGFPREGDMVIAAHNVFPHGFDKKNWSENLTASMYVVSEAQKILSRQGVPSPYEEKGFVLPVDIDLEIHRVYSYLVNKQRMGSEPAPRA